MLVTLDVTLDNHIRVFSACNRIRRFNFFARAQVEHDAAPAVAITRLNHDRQADVFGDFPCRLDAVHHFATGNGYATALEQCLGQVFVASDAFSDCAGEVSLGSPDTVLERAVTELYEVALVETDVRNFALLGTGHDMRRRGPEVILVNRFADFCQFGLDLKWLLIDNGVHQLQASVERRSAHSLVWHTEHHAIRARTCGFAGLTETGLKTRQF